MTCMRSCHSVIALLRPQAGRRKTGVLETDSAVGGVDALRPRPEQPPYRTCEIPLRCKGILRVGPGGLEPPASSLSGMRSNQAELWARAGGV